MYAKYAWNAGATVANVLADLVALYTNVAPSVSALSASCDKVVSVIQVNTALTNWVLHDAVAATGAVALKSLNEDGVTYKYITITVTTTTIAIKGYS